MDLKLFGKNAVIYAIGNLALRTASFLMIPIYTHFLSVNDYGLLATLLLVTQIMVIFMDVGTRKGFMRFAPEYEDKNQIGHVIGSSIGITLMSGLVVTGICLLFLQPLFRGVLHTNQVLGYIILTCCSALVQSLYLYITSYYRAKEEGIKFMIASFSALALLVVTSLVFFLILHQGVQGALMAQIITYGSLWLVVSLNVFSKTNIGFSRELIEKLFRYGFPLVFAMAGNVATEISGMFFLSYFANLEEVAIYSLGYKIAQIASMALILPFQLAYEPFVYAYIDKPEIRATIAKLLTYLMFAFTFVAFGIAFISRDLLQVIAPPEYFAAYLIIFLILPEVAFKGVYYIGESLLSAKNKTQIIGIIVIIFTALSFLLNYLFIPHWGRYGVIFVTNLTTISVAMLLMALGMRVFPIPLEMRRLGVVGVLSILLLSTTFFLSKTSPYIYYILLPIMACASIALLYFGGFCNDDEKTVIRGVLDGIRAKVLA
jgi:O-antigen/teichoic acid export membrane protein